MMDAAYIATAIVVVALLAWDAFRRWLASRKEALSGTALKAIDALEAKLKEQDKRISSIGGVVSRTQVMRDISPIARRKAGG